MIVAPTNGGQYTYTGHHARSMPAHSNWVHRTLLPNSSVVRLAGGTLRLRRNDRLQRHGREARSRRWLDDRLRHGYSRAHVSRESTRHAHRHPGHPGVGRGALWLQGRTGTSSSQAWAARRQAPTPPSSARCSFRATRLVRPRSYSVRVVSTNSCPRRFPNPRQFWPWRSRGWGWDGVLVRRTRRNHNESVEASIAS